MPEESGRTQEYAAALDQLDQLRGAGRISANEYEVRKQALLAESSKMGTSRTTQIALGVVGAVVAVIIAVFLIRAVLGA